MKRTHNNGDLRLSNVNEHVDLIGWVSKKRNLGQLVFIDLRDRSGICQLVFDETMKESLKEVRNEYLLNVSGTVMKRQASNPDLKTGEIEVKVESFEIINSAKTTPIIIADDTDALEDTRLQYRYLDLRRPIMQQKLIMRHQITRSMRDYLDNHGFIEIETPMLGKSTPEGARDYLVPSRVHPGSFYALPQSPQLYKQLLMISGFERYYQFARCFRDEDLRADRQTDFTQVDIETSFLTQDEIIDFTEEMLVKLMKDVKNIEVKRPFLRLTYKEAMNRFGSDKPDNRFGMELQELTDVFKNSSFQVFKNCIESNGSIKGIVVNDFAHISRKEIDKWTNLAKKNGAKGLVTLKAQNHTLTGSASKFLSEDEIQALYDTCKLKENDVLFIVSDTWNKTCNALGALRNGIASELGLKKKNEFSYLWVVDFPMFDWSEEEQRWVACHHPFTQPKEEDIPLLDTDQ